MPRPTLTRSVRKSKADRVPRTHKIAGHRAQRREAIVDTAARLFADVGYADCEIERVATELKIAKGTVYLYFSSKEELFYACVDAGMLALQNAIDSSVESITEPFHRIATAVGAYLQFFEDNSQYAELLIQERASFKNRKQPTYFKYRDSSRGRWRDMYRALQESGRIRDDVPIERMLDAIGSLLYGTMFTNHFIGRSVGADEQRRTVLEIIFRGIWSDRERRAQSTRK